MLTKEILIWVKPARRNGLWAFFLLPGILIYLAACTKTPTTTVVNNTDKEITGFVFKAADNAGILTNDITASISADTISAVFEYGTIVTGLVPTIVFKGKTLSPASNVKQDFSTAIKYTVTAQDGTTKTYTVVKGFVSGNKVITSFQFRSLDNSPNLAIDVVGAVGTDSIILVVPYGSNITALVPFITTTGRQIAPASLTKQDFSNPVNYMVTAANGTTKTYIVRVVQSAIAISGTIFLSGHSDFGLNSTGMVCALDAATGQQKWLYSDSVSIYTVPEVASGLVMDADISGNIFALDVNTGKLVWNFPTTVGNRMQANPTAANGILYQGGQDSFTYALHIIDGTLAWKINQTIGGWSPTVVNNVVYQSVMHGLAAYNATTGATIWQANPSPSYDTSTGFSVNPAVVNGILYTASLDNYLYALDAKTGTTLWSLLTDNVNESSPTVVNGVVYFEGGSSYIYAMNAQTGQVIWRYENGYDVSSAIVANNIVYYGDASGHLVALDATTGKLKWRSPLDNSIQYGPLYFDGAIFIGDYDGFFAFDAVTGNLLWKFAYNRYVFSSATATDKQGNVYHCADSGGQN